MPGPIVVYTEQREARLRRPTLEAVSEARRLADVLGTRVVAVLVGNAVSPLAEELGAYGADSVRLFEDPALASYSTEVHARALGAVVQDVNASVVLLAYTAVGKDLAPRVAAKLSAGLASDCVALAIRDGRLEARRPVYAGKAYATVRFDGEVQMATLRPNVFALGAPVTGRKVETVRAVVDPASRARVTAVEAAGGGKVELSEAQTVVSGGRGLKGPEHFHLVSDLASALGAAAGATRAVVDAGWVDHHMQVGQTGKVVSPQLYIACGISGAIQHLAGMSTSKVIVAINKDPEAPIFKVADYGIVGDVFELLPRLTQAAQSLRSSLS